MDDNNEYGSNKIKSTISFFTLFKKTSFLILRKLRTNKIKMKNPCNNDPEKLNLNKFSKKLLFNSKKFARNIVENIIKQSEVYFKNFKLFIE